jgi:hypothetical protein
MVEHATVNRVVEGSSPSSGANLYRDKAHWFSRNFGFILVFLFRVILTFNADGQKPGFCCWHKWCSNGYTMHKTHFYIIAFMLPLAAIVAAVISKLKVKVPVGYQDESGFHAGSIHSDSNTNWPPFW